MSNTIKAVVAFGLFAIVAACGGQSDQPEEDDTMVVTEQPSGKY